MHIRVRFAKRCICIMVALVTIHAYAFANQQVKLAEADKIFLQKNLYLIAGSLNINVQKALEIQSRSYPNPEFQADINAIDPQNNKYFHAGATGQKAFSIEQLILLGGKRKNEIALAKQNSRQAELELEDLLRNLKQQLHSSFYAVYFDQLTLQKYNDQLQILDTIISNYDIQVQKGNVALKELVRLKSVYLELNNNRSELQQNIEEQQKNLQILLQTEDYVSPEVVSGSWTKFTFLPSLDSLYHLSRENRADWKLAELNTDIASLNLKYQKSIAVPDLSIGASYDQRGGAFNNQVNMNVGIPLPLWNRNKGNIKAAQAGISLANAQVDVKQKEINAEVTQVWRNMNRSITEYEKSLQLYNSDFSSVFNGIAENFKRRNISILEFVDFFEAYNKSLAEINRIRKQLTQSAEAINYTVGTTIYE